MKRELALKKNPDMVTRRIDNETILVPIFRTSDDMDCIYTLNPVASQVWDFIDGKRTLSQIKAMILKHFDTNPREVEREALLLIKDLKKIKALK